MNLKSAYPLKFYPILKERIWGGSKLHSHLNKEKSNVPIGESWEISTIPDYISVVSNGAWKGQNLQSIINENPIEILGTKVFEQYGKTFPLLIKFIDAKSDLSVQLHPNDALAMERHQSLGKEEMWYIMDAEPNSQLMFGFNSPLDKPSYAKHLKELTLAEVLQYEKVKNGDVFHIPTGRVHAIGGGILLAEIQQSSDITYRIFDWNRTDEKGNLRELHTDLALDAIDFSPVDSFKTDVNQVKNVENKMVNSKYFTTHLLELNQPIIFTRMNSESFYIYMCIQGNGILSTGEDSIELKKGETVLIPAVIKEIKFKPSSDSLKLIQVTI